MPEGGVDVPCWLPPEPLWMEHSGQIPACRTWDLSAPQKVHQRPEVWRPAQASILSRGPVPILSRGSETCVTGGTAGSSRDDDPPCG